MYNTVEKTVLLIADSSLFHRHGKFKFISTKLRAQESRYQIVNCFQLAAINNGSLRNFWAVARAIFNVLIRDQEFESWYCSEYTA